MNKPLKQSKHRNIVSASPTSVGVVQKFSPLCQGNDDTSNNERICSSYSTLGYSGGCTRFYGKNLRAFEGLRQQLKMANQRSRRNPSDGPRRSFKDHMSTITSGRNMAA